MNRLAVAIGSVALAALLGFFGFKAYSSLKATKLELRQLREEVRQTKQLAQQESVAASEANQRADEAARSAAASANAKQSADAQRTQAEAQSKESDERRQQADMARVHAETNAQQAAEQAKRAQEQVADMRKEREQELNNMQQALSKLVETHRTATGMTIILPDSTFRFAFDSVDLTQKNRELLSRIAGILLVSKGYGLAVYGYTDDVGSSEYNVSLSERRAKAVQQYLVQAGVPSGIVNTKGYGKTSPLVKGNTSEARARNRRVEIAVTDSQIKYGDDATAVSQ